VLTRAAACWPRQPSRCTNFRTAIVEMHRICPEIVNSLPQILDIHLTTSRQKSAPTPLPFSTRCRIFRAGVVGTFGLIPYRWVTAKLFTNPWQRFSTVWRVSRTCNRNGGGSRSDHTGPKGFNSLLARRAAWHSVCDKSKRKHNKPLSEGNGIAVKMLQNRAIHK
jgi:hypothetical protein